MKPGIYDNIDIKEYHKDKHIVSSTGLKQAKKSTRDFIYYIMKDVEDKLHFDFGNVFELALMDKVNGTNDLTSTTAIKPTENWVRASLSVNPDLKKPAQSKTYQTLQSDFLSNNSGKYIIPDVGDQSMEWIDKMVKSCMASPTIVKLLTGTQYQKSLVWEDEETGVLCKTRPDICKTKRNVILDIKSTLDASPSGFSKQVANLDYPLQAVMQISGALNTGLMESVDYYYWLAVEKREPFNVALYHFQQDDIEYFMDEYNYILKRCAKGLGDISRYKTPDDIYSFNSYGERAQNRHGILDLEIPLWYKNNIL